MKRLLTFALILILAISSFACTKTNNDISESNNDNQKSNTESFEFTVFHFTPASGNSLLGLVVKTLSS